MNYFPLIYAFIAFVTLWGAVGNDPGVAKRTMLAPSDVTVSPSRFSVKLNCDDLPRSIDSVKFAVFVHDSP